MKFRITILSALAGIAIVSFCIGQGKQGVKSQVVPDVKMSDHDKIEKLMGEVADLKSKLATLTEKYDAHTHQLRNLEVAALPGSIECNQTIVQGATAGISHGSVDKICRQIMSVNLGVLTQGKAPIVTTPPRP